ncbi:MAG: glycoside hydrolase family 18 protein [bacterium]|nr:glycoside hydrolase family 18 protein [bacterium]
MSVKKMISSLLFMIFTSSLGCFNKSSEGNLSVNAQRLRNVAFYANWAQFWPGGPEGANDDAVNSPSTFNSFIGGVDKFIYGFLMFGVMPNPNLQCAVNPGSMDLSKSCQFVPAPISIKDMLDDQLKNLPMTIASQFDTYGLISLENFLQTEITAFVGGILHGYPPVYIPLGDKDSDKYLFATFPMYPNQCFTGSEESGNTIEKIFQGLVGTTTCPHKGRIPDPDAFTEIQQLKNTNSNLVTVASYGGWTWTHNDPNLSLPKATENMFHNMVSSKVNRSIFIDTSYSFLTGNGFQGVDFDWEYPGQIIFPNNANFDDYANFAYLLQEYHDKYPDFIISMQASGFLSGDVVSQQMPGMQGDKDYFQWLGGLLNNGLSEVNIMAYDYYTASVDSNPVNNITRPNAPLYCKGFPNPQLATQVSPDCVTSNYVVKSGDGLWQLSQDFNTSVQNIKLVNNLSGDQIDIGQTLSIPGPNWKKSCLDNSLSDKIDLCLTKTLSGMQDVLNPVQMSKMIMGLAMYGRTFQLSAQGMADLNASWQEYLDNNQTADAKQKLLNKSIGLNFSGPAPAGSYSQQAGILSFYEINNREWTVKGYSNEYGTSVAIDLPNGIWVTYDDVDSIEYKMDLAKQFKVGGVMNFVPQQDDFSQGYILTSIIGNNLRF